MWEVGILRVCIQKQTVSNHQIRQNLWYKIRKTEKVRKNLEGDKVCDCLLPPYLYLFCILPGDTATSSNIGFPARKDSLAREAFFL